MTRTFLYNVKCSIVDRIYSSFIDLCSIFYKHGIFADDKEKRIIEINKASKFPFPLLSYYKPTKWDSHSFLGDNIEHYCSYMSYGYRCGDWKVEFGGYPYDNSSYRLIKMVLLSDKYSLCGLSVGMDISECSGVFEKFGFTQTQNHSFHKYCIPPFTEYFEFIKEMGWEEAEDIDEDKLHEHFKEYYSKEICKVTVWKFFHTDKIEIKLEFADDKLSLIEINIHSEYVSGYEY